MATYKASLDTAIDLGSVLIHLDGKDLTFPDKKSSLDLALSQGIDHIISYTAHGGAGNAFKLGIPNTRDITFDPNSQDPVAFDDPVTRADGLIAGMAKFRTK